MRLWTLHPRYLDAKGLVAVWREGLLAQRVISGGTRGYRNHPQLHRFQKARSPEQAIAAFLVAIAAEADSRGYSFDSRLIVATPATDSIRATEGQLLYEWQHLRRKLAERDPEWLKRLVDVKSPDVNQLFIIEPGDVAPWEKVPGENHLHE